MKRCGGTYTLSDAVGEASTLEEMATASSEFPSIIRTDGWTDKKAALQDAKAKAKAAADEWCGKRDCKVGDCHQIGPPDIEVLDEDESEVTSGPLKGIKFYAITIKITKVTCGCKKPKPPAAKKANANAGAKPEEKEDEKKK